MPDTNFSKKRERLPRITASCKDSKVFPPGKKVLSNQMSSPWDLILMVNTFTLAE